MTRPLLAKEGHKFFSFSGFNEPALEVGLHLHVHSVTALPHGDRYTRHMPLKLCDAAATPRVARINASLVGMFHVKQSMARWRSPIPIKELTARTLRSFDQKPYMSPNDAF